MNIQKILVPTDFSDTANNALSYATELAIHFGAEIEILNAFSVPHLTVRGKAVLPEDEEIEARMHVARTELEKIKEIASANNHVKFSTKAILINWQTDLAEVIQEQHADLIVMGTTGSSGLKKFFFGSNTARVIKNSSVPALVIPEGAKLSQKITIGFAYDGLKIDEPEKLSIISLLGSVFDATVHIFQILKAEELPSVYLDDIMKSVPEAEYIEVNESSVESGILKCIELGHLDLMVMMLRQDGLFHTDGSLTERIVYESSIPLLVIPE